MSARVRSLQSSRGGVPKLSVDAARVGALGLEGDAVAHPRVHGGPDRALCLYAWERIQALREEGHDVAPGALGENVTLEGVDFATIAPGDRLLLGSVVEVEVTRFTTPCATIARFFADGDPTRVLQEKHPGWSRVYARVLREGPLRAGDPVVRRERDASVS